MLSNYKNCVIFSLSASKKLAQKVSDYLNVKLGHITISHFADGETMVKSVDSLRGKDVYVIQSTSYPVNDNLMELLIAIDSFKRASAKSINVIIPYFGYSRQDRKTDSREPITCKLVSKLIENAGATRITICDLHSEQTQGFFEIPVDIVSGVYILSEQIKKNENLKNSIIVSPDYGSVKRARKIANILSLPLAILDKYRPKQNVCKTMNVLGDVYGKNCIVVDDMIDTAGSLYASCEILKKFGAKKIIFGATHGLFNSPATKVIKLAFKKKFLDKLYVSNSLDSVYTCGVNEIKIFNLAPLIAELIKIYNGCGYKTISKLYNHTNKD